MSSLNPYYTFNYSQPEEYRFSHDSVFLSRQVFDLTHSLDLTNIKVLDLCSGCGIVGLDFLFHRQKAGLSLPAKTDFVEVQDIYREHFEKNVFEFKTTAQPQAHLKLQFVNQSYDWLQNAECKNAYDLVICNPPYFRPHQGKLSNSEFKNRCRFFIDSDFENLIKALDNCCAPQAQVFILLNSLDDHGIDVETEIRQMTGNFKLKKLGLIRSTDFWRLEKN